MLTVQLLRRAIQAIVLQLTVGVIVGVTRSNNASPLGPLDGGILMISLSTRRKLTIFLMGCCYPDLGKHSVARRPLVWCSTWSIR